MTSLVSLVSVSIPPRRLFWAAIAFAVFGAAANSFGQVLPPAPNPIPTPPTIAIVNCEGVPVAKVSTEVGLPVHLKAVVDGTDITWVSLEPGLSIIDGSHFGGDPKGFRAETNKAGVYRVLAYTNKAGKNSKPAIVALTFTAPTPPPVPPGPGPGPTPVATALWIVTVDDTTARTPATATLLGDLAYWQSLSTAGHKWAHLDSANPAAASFAKQTNATGLPCAIMMDFQGNVLQSVKLPADKASMDAIIKTLTGAK